MGMIWDHHIVENNYGHHLPIGTPYQLLVNEEMSFIFLPRFKKTFCSVSKWT